MGNQRRRLDGVYSPVFQKSSEVDWFEIRHEWEDLTGKKLHYSWWKGIIFWILLVGIFVYLQAGFFNLYFSKPYLEGKVAEVETLAKNLNQGQVSSEKISQAEESLNNLKIATQNKGQFFVFLSFNPLFKGKVIDLSRFLLVTQRVEAIKSLILQITKKRPENLREWQFDFWLAHFYLKEMNKEFSLIQEPKIKIYYHAFDPRLKQLKTDLKFVQNHLSEILWALGQIGDRRYLFLFPNNKEERNWGGYSGTYGELEISKDKLSFFNRDIYWLDWLVRGNDVNSIKKPEEANDIPTDLAPDQKIFPESQYTWWYLRNSATSLDFKTNALRAIWTYKNVHKQNQVDGVIALTPDLIIDIFKIIGPIEMPDYEVTISADNFRDIVEYKVEVDNPFKKEKDRSQSPKQILADLAPKFFAKIESSSIQDKIKIVEAVLKNLKDKQLMVYLENPAAQNLLEQYNWAGRLKSYPWDFLAVYSSNMNGCKSSLGLERKINLSSNIDEKGLVSNQLELEYYYKENPIRFGGKIDNLIEIALPKGIVLKNVTKNGEDFTAEVKFSEEENKTILFFLMSLNPLEKTKFILNYTLANSASKDWGLLFQKQPGIEAINFRYNLSSSRSVKIPEGVNENLVLSSDREFKVNF